MAIPIKYNLRYLAARWEGTLTTAGTFALVVATFVIVMSLARGIEHSLTVSGDPLNVLILRQGAQAEGQSACSREQYRIVREMPGIARDALGEPIVAPEAIVLVNKPRGAEGKTTNLQVRGVSPASVHLRPALRLVEGRMFRPGLREIIVSRSVAERFQGMRLGGETRLGRAVWKVVGIFEAKGTSFDSEVWANVEELMVEADHPAYSTLLARADGAAGVEQIRRGVEDDVRLKLTAKTEQAYYRDQTQTAGALKVFGAFLAVMMSIGASFAAMNTMYASVASRSREIATLRVLGFRRRAILLSFLIESVALSLIGGALGCALSLPINGLATGTMNFETFSEIVFYFTITPGLMLEGLAFAIIMGGLGGFLPALTASRAPILESLRQG